jgi:hypothetical protein
MNMSPPATICRTASVPPALTVPERDTDPDALKSAERLPEETVVASPGAVALAGEAGA